MAETNGGDTPEEDSPGRARNLSRAPSAMLVSFANMAVCILAIITLVASWKTLPSRGVVWAGAGLLFVSAVLLSWASGYVSDRYNEIRGVVAGSRRKVVGESRGGWSEQFADASGSPLLETSWVYYTLLGLGIIGIATITVATGGMAESPYREVLVATFLLGELRSPTPTAFLSVFGFGVVVAALTQVAFEVWQHVDAAAWVHFHLSPWHHLWPGLLVASVTTWVTYVTLFYDARLPEDG